MTCFEAGWLDGFETGWLDGSEITWLDGFKTGWIDTNAVVATQLIFQSANLFVRRFNSSLRNHLVGQVQNRRWSDTNAVVAGQLMFIIFIL